VAFDRQVLFRRLLKARFFTRFYARIIGPASVQMFTEPLRQELLEHLTQGSRVLEVGCGPGLQALELARQRPDLELTASDFSAEFVHLGSANAARAGASVKFVVADAMDLSEFPAGSFDAVYSLTAIKHFPDPVRGLQQCLRLLKPGGRLVVAEIRRESLLEEVASLVALFRVPGWLKGLMTRIVYGSLREECPPLADIQRWLSDAGVGDPGAAPRALVGRPAWVATIVKPPAAQGPA
jgi:ubiquinone/menaquinone biosynthesis C-methylase UbiE